VVAFDTLMHIYKGMSVKGIPFFSGNPQHSMKKGKKRQFKNAVFIHTTIK